MTAVVNNSPDLASRMINRILAIKPLSNIAKHQARQMMINRAQTLGIDWNQQVKDLSAQNWSEDFQRIRNPQLTYPDYYLTSFHAYDDGNLNWQAAFEQEPAAYTVHAKIWHDTGVKGDPKLRQTYHDILTTKISTAPRKILDVGCGVGLSTFALQKIYPQAEITGLDLSPHFLSVAQYNSRKRHQSINWVHGAAESTGFTPGSFDLASIFLLCHELPQSATRQILAEMRRIVRPGGYLGIMDMNPGSEIYKKMPTYVKTLLKSTEPYLDEYFSLDIEQAIINAGFKVLIIAPNSPRHRTIVAEAV